MRNTQFKGWANDIDYLPSEAERQKRVERAIELHRKMREDEVRPLALKWRLMLIVCVILGGCYVVYELLDAVLKAVGL